jgi:hypothetical protein
VIVIWKIPYLLLGTIEASGNSVAVETLAADDVARMF